MAPTVDMRRRRAVRRVQRLSGENDLLGPLPWTVGDDSEDETEIRQSTKTRRQIRRQTTVLPAPGAVPPPAGTQEQAAVPTIDDVESESTVNDGFSSPSSESSGEDEKVESEKSPSPTKPSSLSSTASSSGSIKSTSSSSDPPIVFTTLVPGSDGGVPGDDDYSSSKLVTLTVSSYPAEETKSSTRNFPAPAPQITMSSSRTASDAVASTAVADADASATPQFIRIHEHPHGLSGDAIHGLIAFGALGGLMGALAIFWFFWRRWKKSNGSASGGSRNSSDDSFSKPSRHLQWLEKVPYLKTQLASRGWLPMGDPYDNDNNSREDVYFEKSIARRSSAAPRLDSQFFAPNQLMGVAVRVQGGDREPTVTHNQPSHQPNKSISSIQRQNSQTQRQKYPPFPVKPTKRMSEGSSLSSGFGDGDMPMPNGESTMERLPQPPPSAKFSSFGGSRRDTVYTEASEDLPPRFRNVNSWVKQQTSRVKRSQQRAADEEAPPVPQMPQEETYAMMLPDGEVPRQAESRRGSVDGGAR